jgi:hypothetical protein
MTKKTEIICDSCGFSLEEKNEGKEKIEQGDYRYIESEQELPLYFIRTWFR